MSAEDLRSMSVDELQEKLAEAKEELFNLRFQLATSQLDNTARLGNVRKQIARILSVIRQREIEEWRAGQATAGKDS